MLALLFPLAFRFITRTQQGGGSLAAVSFLLLLCFLQFSSLGVSVFSLIIKRYSPLWLHGVYEMIRWFCKFGTNKALKVIQQKFLAWGLVDAMQYTISKNCEVCSYRSRFLFKFCIMVDICNLLLWLMLSYIFRLTAGLMELRHYLKGLFPRPLTC